jgi:hypothetical protein
MIIGLVGKSNTGKSTFFKAATLAEVEIANYPFTTIEKNEGITFVKIDCVDKDLNVKCQPKYGFCLNNKRFVPVQLIDVAGLVPEAHLGKGRGNQFLNDLNQADVLIHIVDISGSTNEKGEPTAALSYDPTNDIKFLEVELDMWYFQIIEKGWARFVKQIIQEKKDICKALGKQLSALKVTEDVVERVVNELNLNKEKPNEWCYEDLKQIAIKLRKRTKPMIIACNKIDVKGAEENFYRLKEQFKDNLLIACSAESELALREAAKHELIKYVPGGDSFEILKKEELNEKQLNALDFIKNNILNKLGNTGVQQVLDKAVFELLKYIAVYPVENENKLTDIEGRVLPDVYLLKDGSTALDLAYKIHTDIGNKFSCAIDARTKKRLSKEYILKNRDVLKIITN